jgi:hypothetical protein
MEEIRSAQLPAVLAEIEHLLNKILRNIKLWEEVIGIGMPLILNNLAYCRSRPILLIIIRGFNEGFYN